MSFRCVVCQFWIVDGRCACPNGPGSIASGAHPMTPTRLAELGRWVRRGALAVADLPYMGVAGSCGCHCILCFYGHHHAGCRA